MRILIDTNILISGLFFHGLPNQLLQEIDFETYIVSGDNDLLTIKNFAGIEIVTAREFYEKYLK